MVLKMAGVEQAQPAGFSWLLQEGAAGFSWLLEGDGHSGKAGLPWELTMHLRKWDGFGLRRGATQKVRTGLEKH